MALLAAPIACSGTLIIGEGELAGADSGAEASVLDSGGLPGQGGNGWGGAADSAAGAAGMDASAGDGGAESGGTAGVGGSDASAEDGSAGDSAGGVAGSGGSPNPGLVACGNSLCAAPADCCYLNASCFDPATEPDACPSPPDDGGEGKPCGADSHCAPGEYCRNTNVFSCVGPGRCTARDIVSCTTLMSDSETCACDGITRPERESCKMGVRAFSGLPMQCGQPLPWSSKSVYYCGNDPSWCPAGMSCCGITGYCYDPATPELCEVPPSWALLPCVVDADCPMALSFCQGSQCGGPGGCKPVAPECKGSLDPVCGCNGKTYMNEACASNDRVATDYVGMCPDSGL